LPDDFEHHADIVVGCVMLGLGLYGYAKVFSLLTQSLPPYSGGVCRANVICHDKIAVGSSAWGDLRLRLVVKLVVKQSTPHDTGLNDPGLCHFHVFHLTIAARIICTKPRSKSIFFCLFVQDHAFEIVQS
jgi:hypothetical protein